MAERQITITVEGAIEDDGHVRLNDLIKQLEFVRNALRRTEHIVTGKTESQVYYRVVDLHHNSPATIVLEAAPARQSPNRQVATRTVSTFFRNLRWIQEKADVPNRVDVPTLEAYRSLGLLLEQNMTSIKITNSRQTFKIDDAFTHKVNEIIGPDETIEGSMAGRLEWLNIHNTNVFHIYPEVGPKKLNCFFKKEMRDEVIAAIDRHVRVYGQLRYKRRDKFPYAINVDSLERLPHEEELPTLESFRGSASNPTGMTPDALIRWLRDGN